MDTGIAGKRETVLTQSSYAAADMLIQQSRSFITPATPLEIGALTDLDNPNELTNFGNMVAQQIASRFVQLGYNVSATADLTGAPSAMGEAPPSYAMPGTTAAPGRLVITGRYAVARDAVLVNLRLIEAATGKVAAAYDYTVPKTMNIRELTKTEAGKKSWFDF